MGQSTQVWQRFHHTFFCGDLNYRIDGSRAMVDQCLMNNEIDRLLSKDQLTIELQKLGPTPSIFSGWKEANKITFKPTFKFDIGHHTFDTILEENISCVNFENDDSGKEDKHLIKFESKIKNAAQSIPQNNDNISETSKKKLKYKSIKVKPVKSDELALPSDQLEAPSKIHVVDVKCVDETNPDSDRITNSHLNNMILPTGNEWFRIFQIYHFTIILIFKNTFDKNICDTK